MAFYENKLPADAPIADKALNWVDARFPLSSTWKAHLSEYYAPKNFNFLYVFGSLALLVLVIQIVTGIFLVMHYKPDATLAFASVEYIMRSEEHTSELQSLMRISYAVFCLKKKITKYINTDKSIDNSCKY